MMQVPRKARSTNFRLVYLSNCHILLFADYYTRPRYICFDSPTCVEMKPLPPFSYKRRHFHLNCNEYYWIKTQQTARLSANRWKAANRRMLPVSSILSPANVTSRFVVNGVFGLQKSLPSDLFYEVLNNSSQSVLIVLFLVASLKTCFYN